MNFLKIRKRIWFRQKLKIQYTFFPQLYCETKYAGAINHIMEINYAFYRKPLKCLNPSRSLAVYTLLLSIMYLLFASSPPTWLLVRYGFSPVNCGFSLMIRLHKNNPSEFKNSFIDFIILYLAAENTLTLIIFSSQRLAAGKTNCKLIFAQTKEIFFLPEVALWNFRQRILRKLFPSIFGFG